MCTKIDFSFWVKMCVAACIAACCHGAEAPGEEPVAETSETTCHGGACTVTEHSPYFGMSALFGRALNQTYGATFDRYSGAWTRQDVSVPMTQEKFSGGLGLGAFWGYQWLIGESCFAEVELLAQLQNLVLKNGYIFDTNSNDRVRVDVTKKETFGVMGRWGKIFDNNWAGFVQMGLVNSLIQTEFQGVVGDGHDVSTSKKKRVWGGRFGFGGSKNLLPQVDVRLDYAYTQYQKFSVAGDTYQALPITSVSMAMNPVLSDHLLMVSCVYRFKKRGETWSKST